MGSILWLYLLCVGSFGIYALVWVYRCARSEAGQKPSNAIAWALGCTAAPIACAVLYALGRGASARLAREGRRSGPPPWLAPALHAGIALLLLLSPLGRLWAPVWLLAPLPLLVVHGRLRAAASAASEPAAPRAPLARWRRPVELGVVIVGLPLVIAATYRLDAYDAQVLWASRQGELHVGADRAYELSVPDAGWRQLAPGTLGDPDSDLELISDDRQSWVIVYLHASDTEIDAVVDARRALIFANETLRGLDEDRFFLETGDLLPVSLASYRVGENPFTYAQYVVLTALLDDRVVEVVGYTANPKGQLERVRALVTSLAVPADEAPSPEDT